MRQEMVIGSLALGLVMLSVAGCATSEPGERALVRSNTAVASGVDAGTHAMETLDELELKARYNPCHCPAPDYEVYLRGNWQRIAIDGDDEIMEQLETEARALSQSSPLGFVWMTGRLNGTTTFEQTGVSYESFYVADVRFE